MQDSLDLPIACDLGALSESDREREQALLAEFRSLADDPVETDKGYRFALPPDARVLSLVGEFLELERLCCPFLTFDLAVSARRGPITLHVRGGEGVKTFIRATFAGGS